MKEQLNNTKSILQRREAQLQTLEQQIVQLKTSKTESGDIARLENENRTLQDRLSSYELERTELTREVEWLQSELEQQKNSPNQSNNESIEQDQQWEILIGKKQQRIEELEQAVRESLQITTEREYAMTQLKRKMENLEKQVRKKNVHSRRRRMNFRIDENFTK